MDGPTHPPWWLIAKHDGGRMERTGRELPRKESSEVEA